MSSFDFASLLIFLQSLFDAFVNLFKKMGFSFGGDENKTSEEDSSEDASSEDASN